MAAAKKSFKNNPAFQFISTQTEETERDEEPIEEKKLSPIGEAPEGFRLNPLYIETKSRRLQLLIPPSLFKRIKARADRDGQSVNEICNKAIEEFLKGDNA